MYAVGNTGSLLADRFSDFVINDRLTTRGKTKAVSFPFIVRDEEMDLSYTGTPACNQRDVASAYHPASDNLTIFLSDLTDYHYFYK